MRLVSGNKIGEESSAEDEVNIEEIEIEYDSNTVHDISVSIIKKNKKNQIFVIISKSDGSWESSTRVR